MKGINIIIVFATVLLSVACIGKKDITKRNIEATEEEFYSTFTEATKYALLGNFKNALGLYQLCIREFPEKSAPYYQVSNIYLTANDVTKAKAYARKAAELDDSNKWYLLHLANIYQYENNIDSVIYLYEKIIKLTDNPEYRYNLALFYSSRGDYDKSMVLISELERELEGSREIFIIKHNNYAALNYQDSAIIELENLIYFFPDEFENYGMLAEYLSEINKFDESRIVYQELLDIQPDNGLANISYGDFFIKQGKKDSALYYYSRGFASDDIAIEDKIGLIFNYIYDPVLIKTDTIFIEGLITVLKDKYHEHRPYTLSAEYNIKRQRYKEAILDLEKAIGYNVDSYVVWEQYIMIANFLGLHEKVKEIYVKAIAKFPNEINLYIYSGYSLYFLEEYNEVVGLCKEGSKIDEAVTEQKVQCLNLLADTYRELKELNISDSIYEEILIIDPENLLVRNNYSYYLSVRGKNLKRAEELSRLTVKREPKNATYLDTYGWILFKMGNSKSALKYIELAIKQGAYNNSEVLDHYGDIMIDLNRCNEAIEAWREAIKYDESIEDTLNQKIKKAESSICNE